INKIHDKIDNDSIKNFNHDYIAMSNVLNNNDSIIKSNPLIERNFFNKLLGYDRSLRFPLEKAKAALIYPPRGIHTLLIGENGVGDRKSTRLNSSHVSISYAVLCLK